MDIKSCIKRYKEARFKNINTENRECWIKRQLHILPEGTSILDAGAGQMRWKEDCRHLRYTSQDFDQYDGKGDEKGLQNGSWNTGRVDIVSDIIDIPVENASYDAVLCTEVLEHLPSPELAIKEFGRIVREGGGYYSLQPHFVV